ncbi:acyl-CoA thioesterase [Haloechinothrix salitolerans]|uniref:Acyl-CoA thioesterase n=1 Tax=Haloechinothrix salitolerans TaxID=926830 RepID=A0ABW2C446_9PSEU
MGQGSTSNQVTHRLVPREINGFWRARIHPWSYDFDYLGHLTAAIYPKAFEEGRVRYLAERWATPRPAYVVASHRMEYLAEIRETTEPLQVLIRPLHVGRSSLRLEEALLDPDERVCNTSVVTLVAWDTTARRSRPLTIPERTALEHDMATLTGAGSPLIP